MGDAIQKQILSDISQCKYFSGSASSRQKLKSICVTRWVERHDSIIIFVTLLPEVISTLEELQQENKQVEVAAKAQAQKEIIMPKHWQNSAKYFH